MKRRHAIAVALTFVLVGLMFFAVDTPLAIQSEVVSVLDDALEIVEQLADAPVPQGPMKMNVMQNPSFEEWDAMYYAPDDWSCDTSTFLNADRAYTGDPKYGSYAGYIEAKGSGFTWAYQYLENDPDRSTYYPYLRYGIEISIDWYAIANPDLIRAGMVYLEVQIQNTTGDSHVLYYYLSHRASGWTNSTDYGYFLLNDTIGSWHTFDRNITEDYLAVFPSEYFSDSHYINRFYIRISSPYGASGNVQAVVDNLSFHNSTYSGWTVNGDFESGTGTHWYYYALSNEGHLEPSVDCTDGDYSMNMSAIAVTSYTGSVAVNKYYYAQNSFFAFSPGSNIISWDWKYSDDPTAGSNQYANLQLNFNNGSDYYVTLYMGRGDDYMRNNQTNAWYIPVSGFGTRDTWVHSEIDLYELTQNIGLFNHRISVIRFNLYQSVSIPNSRVQVLIDNFKMVTYPMANPTFEYVDVAGIYEPFMGWYRTYIQGEVTQTADSHSGSSAANITVENGYDGFYRYELMLDFDPNLFIDFWWRLDDIQSSGQSFSYIDFEFLNHLGGNNHIIYVLGRSDSMPMINGTQFCYIMVDGFNQTGTWTHLSRNITSDIEEAFSAPPDDWRIYQITVLSGAGPGMRTSLLVDDFNLKDLEPPSVDSVLFDATPMYYEDVLVRVSTTDVRPGVSSVFVLYSIDSWSSTEVSIGVYDEADWYNVTIPTQVYNTHVDFYIQVVDGCNNEKIDDNGGLFYSYTVDDDVNPSLSFVTPSHYDEVEGDVSVEINAYDEGSGVAFVELYIGDIMDMTLVMNYTSAPYVYSWNTDLEDLGEYMLYAHIVDNEGLWWETNINVTVVDTIAPELNSPTDIEFTIGETGYTIDWDPTDLRPYGYLVYLDGEFYKYNFWNATSEHVVVELDGLAVGVHNFTCVVVDDGDNGAIDTVIVTVNPEVTTPTTTTTTDTGTTSTTPVTTTTTTGLTGGGDLLSPLLIATVVGVVGILLVVFVVIAKMKKS